MEDNKEKPSLNGDRRNVRLKSVQKYMLWTKEQESVLISDKKK